MNIRFQKSTLPPDTSLVSWLNFETILNNRVITRHDHKRSPDNK